MNWFKSIFRKPRRLSQRLSNNDKYYIAEYIYSRERGILIKADGEALLRVMKRHKVDQAKACTLDQMSLDGILNRNLSEAEQQRIMSAYMKGELQYK